MGKLKDWWERNICGPDLWEPRSSVYEVPRGRPLPKPDTLRREYEARRQPRPELRERARRALLNMGWTERDVKGAGL